MPTPFLGQIQPFAFSRAPDGWTLCDGRIVSIGQNPALFALIGTQFGGDGFNNFALPDLRGRVPIGQGVSLEGVPYKIGEKGGVVSVTLTSDQLPAHSHPLIADGAAAVSGSVSNNYLSQTASPNDLYAPASSPLVPLDPMTVHPAGAPSPAPHDNMQPSLVIAYYIATAGVFPSRP